jgi:hypothetical protein
LSEILKEFTVNFDIIVYMNFNINNTENELNFFPQNIWNQEIKNIFETFCFDEIKY